MKKLLLLIFPLFIEAQDVPIGYWKDYQSYTSASYIAEADNKIYCVTNGGLFYINKDDNTTNRMSKVNGLSDVRVKQVAYSEELKITMITYENCNIDLIKKNKIINISDIKRKEITGLKSINNITLRNGIAYLSCNFGLVLIDLEKEEIKDTYKIGDNGNFLEINDCTYDDNKIYVATSDGVFLANINSPNLFNYISWTRDSSWVDVYQNIYTIGNNVLWGSDNETSFTNNTLTIIDNDTIFISHSENIYQFDKLYHEKITKPRYSIKDLDGFIWIADEINGLLKFENYEYQENFIPEGPVRNDIYSLEFEENRLYQCHGGHNNFSSNGKINDGASIRRADNEWINYNSSTLGGAIDILAVAVRNGTEYYASWRDGLSKIKNGELILKYNYENTDGVLETSGSSNNRIKISDLKFDDNGNLWGLNSEVNHPLFVKTKNDEWFSFSMNQNRVELFFDDLIIDKFNQKWGVIGRSGGLFVYNDNNTISDPSDDQYITLKNTIGQGKLPSMGVHSIAEDLDGEIWVGTDKGIGVFYNPSAIFSGNNFDAQQILITEGEYGQYLLSEEKIKCIAIDGANRKWIGTEKSGVFLLSEDGIKEIQHFTIDNSPLFSNNISDITINPKNGEVFIGTEKGLLSFRSDATSGSTIQSTTKVFPNPVRETYNGIIAISGLVTDANIKITDIDGNLVFEDFAKGGQVSWSGKNKNGNRISTGVYVVFSTDINGIEKIVSKILFIK